MLDVFAGPTALTTIKEQGIQPNLFTTMLGASGGPKWFTLFGLDKYLFGEFFKDRRLPLDLIGSSAGAFRFAALSQHDPVKAITNLANIYSNTVYSDNADANEITGKAKDLIREVYPKAGIAEAINNPVFRPHFIVAKCSGLTASQSKLPQLAGLLGSLALNRINRSLLANQYQRYVFKSEHSTLTIAESDPFSTHYHTLTQNNFAQALLASGSIPMVMNSVNYIAGAPNGVYRDGGIIDYHFDVNIEQQQGLILYPHFNDAPKPGWFDKNLSRQCSDKNYDKVVMLSPSRQFIDSLPFKKIPDRKDFTDMDASTRIRYWTEVLKQTEQLADSFEQFVNQQSIDKIKPLPF